MELTGITLPDGVGLESRPGVLPGFATPDWLGENHHLMKADLRKLASAMAEEYPDWTADGSDAQAFWRAVHDQAERWTWFLWLFEDRILKIFGRVKGRRKQLVPRLLIAAADRARAIHPLARDEPEPYLLEDIDTLWQAGEHLLVAQVVWAMSCLEDADSRNVVAGWTTEPVIDDLVGDAVQHALFVEHPDRRHLLERLEREPAGPRTEKLVERADAEYAALEKDVVCSWRQLQEYVAAHDDYAPALGELSIHVLQVEWLSAELMEIDEVRQSARARCRRAALCTLLEEAMHAVPEALEGDTATLKSAIATIGEDGLLPLVFPDREWERCSELAKAFRAALVDPGEQELALREASRRYAEDPNAANRDALHAAMAAERDNPRSIEPASDILDRIVACLTALTKQFGRWTEEDGLPPFPKSRDRIRALNHEIAGLKEANREAGERAAALQAELHGARDENDGLRRAQYRLLERLAAIDGGERRGPTEGAAAPALASYEELPAWLAEHFAGRVVLAGRGLRALKGAEFEDVGLVGKAIHLLATTYWRMKTCGGLELRDAFENALRDLRLLETPSIRPGQQGRARDDFVVEWDRRRLTLDRHIKNRSGTRNPKRCFRLYFSWDDVSRQVVIGHLPGHMKTPGT
ncbi:MAG: hypothetical protein OXQ84_21715 [bacterium]|nr:hypothetical protein [bacterium]